MPWFWPVNSNRITQVFSSGHKAVDIGVATGTPIVAPTSGKIIKSGWDTSGYGNLVVIQSGENKIYLAHLSKFAVGEGQQVKAGQVIGYSGSTGNSTGPHLHYEVRSGSGFLDPLKNIIYGTAKALSMPSQSTQNVPSKTPTNQKPEETKLSDNIVSKALSGIDWTPPVIVLVGILLIFGGAMRFMTKDVNIEHEVKKAAGATVRAAISGV